MKIHVIPFFAFALATATTAFGANITNLFLKATTDKENPIDYAVGENIRFDFFLDGAELPPEMATNTPLSVSWTRRGDDGVKTTGKSAISLENGFSLTTSLGVPGFVRISAKVVGANNKAYTFEYSPGKTLTDFEFGAGVDTRKMRLSTIEPADFDAFWAEAKAKLATVPFNDENVELVDVTPSSQTKYCTTYAVKIPCYGPRPVTGWLIVPKNAAPGTLDVRAVFDGYGMIKAAPSPPTYNSGTSQIRFNVNAHGYDLLGHDDQYYLDMYNTLYPLDRKSYALEASDYDNPTNTYFYYMAMRVMRAFDYLKSRPEWNGRVVIAEGGSQGGLQTMWAGGLVEGISEIRPSVTWCCDLGNPFPSTNTSPLITKGWGVPSVPGAYYFDAALHAKRVPVTCQAKLTRLGMGDYTCPPRGVLLSYYLMKCPATAKLVQGSTHSYTPSGENQTYTLTKEAGAGIFSNVDVYDAAGYDWTNRVVTVTGLPAGTEVALALSSANGSAPATTVTATSDLQGVAVIDVPTAPGANYAYTISEGGEVIGTGTFYTGGWNVNGEWFLTAPDGHGGATEVNGAWRVPPVVTNDDSFAVGESSAFALAETARAEGGEKLVRVETRIVYPAIPVEGATPTSLSLSDSIAAIRPIRSMLAGGAGRWVALVGGTWTMLSGDIEPDIGIPYIVRMEGDFSLSDPRVRFSVSEDNGTTFAPLSDSSTGAEWLVATDATRRALAEVATMGEGTIAGISGALSNADVATAEGTGYATLEEALASGGEVSLLTNATWPDPAPVGTHTAPSGGYDIRGAAVQDGRIVVQSGYAVVGGDGKINIDFEALQGLGIATANKSPAEIAAALQANGANGIPKWQSYVLGLDPSNPDARPQATIAVNGGKIELSLFGIEVNDAAGATVTYKVYEVSDLSDTTQVVPVGGDRAVDTPAELDMDAESASHFYRLGVDIQTP